MQLDSLFGGRYRIIRLLGSGGCGQVYLAENIHLKSFCAIKEIELNKSNQSQINLEIEVLKKVKHPALPRIFDVVYEKDSVFLMEDYMEGDTVEQILREQKRINEKTAVRWAIEICSIMEYLHSQRPEPIIYRDLKPSNIILSPDGSIKLVDFGSARKYKVENQTDTVYIGTRGYAAPEQYGLGQTSKRSDIYSFGMTMLHVLTGIRPAGPVSLDKERFIRENLDAGEGSTLSFALKRLVKKCVATEIDERFADFSEIRLILKNILNSRKTAFTGTCRRENEEIKERWAELDPMKPSVLDMATASNRCTVLSVVQNYEFAFELAWVLAEHMGLNTLVIDFDFQSAVSGWYMTENKNVPADESELYREIDMYRAVEIVNRRYSGQEDGVFGLEQPFYMKSGKCWPQKMHLIKNDRTELIRPIIEKLSADKGIFFRRFLSEVVVQMDVCILLSGRSGLFEITAECFRASHYVLEPANADIIHTMDFERSVYLAEMLGIITMDKMKFIAWDFSEKNHGEVEYLYALADFALAGIVHGSKKRNTYRYEKNGKKPYAADMERIILKDYMDIVDTLEIVKSTQSDLFHDRQSDLFHSRQSNQSILRRENHDGWIKRRTKI